MQIFKTKILDLQEFFECLVCNRLLDSTKEAKTKHKCWNWLCVVCKKYVDNNHLYYTSKQNLKTPSDKLIFFYQELDQSSGEHIVISP